MNEISYYTIGEVSKICGVAPSTLRYYDKINLVKPNIVSASNSYRFYNFKDIAKIRIIQNLRDLNFSLEDIESILNKDDLSYQLLLMKKKHDDIYNEIQSLQKTFDAIHNRIINMENEIQIISSKAINELSIELKELPKRKVLYIRKQSRTVNLSLYTLYFNELVEIAKENKIIPSLNLMVIHHHINLNNSFNEQEHIKSIKDVEVCLTVDCNESDSSFVRYLPDGLHLCMLTRGTAGKEGFQKIYYYIHTWLKENNYIAAGPLMDFLISDLSNLHPDNIVTDLISEIQVPIIKRAEHLCL